LLEAFSNAPTASDRSDPLTPWLGLKPARCPRRRRARAAV